MGGASKIGCALIVLTAGAGAPAVHAGVALVRRFETWGEGGLRIANPSGIAFLPSTGTFLVVDGDRDSRGGNAWEITLDGRGRVGALDLAPVTRKPSDLVYHGGRKTLFVTDDDELRLLEVDLSGRGLATIDLAALGSNDPEGIACAPARDRLFIADGHGEQVLVLSTAGRLVDRFSTERLGFGNAAAIAYDQVRDRLLVVSDDDDVPLLLELTPDGQLLEAHSLLDLGVVRPRGLVLAPSSDSRDPAETQSLYVADAMTKGVPDGRVLELARIERPRRARVLTHLAGDVDGFGFRGDEPGFAAGDLDHDGVLEPGERLPASLRQAKPPFDNRDPEDARATDVLVTVADAAPLRFAHAVDLGGKPAVWARLSLVVGDARVLPGARNLVRVDGRLVGEIVGSREERLYAGAIEATVLELPPQALRDLADEVLELEITRPPGTGGDDLMLDYSRLEVAVAR